MTSLLDSAFFAFALAGALYVFHGLAKVGKYGYIRVFQSGRSPDSYGKYAVITGATDGIGKQVALALAKRNSSLLLISRTQEKLENVKTEIESSFPNYTGTVELLAIDFSSTKMDEQNNIPEIYSKIKSVFQVLGGELGILVNNVGVSYDFPMFYDELDFAAIQNLVNLNVTTTTMMTKLFLDEVLKKKTKLKGSVINIGSYAGIMASPLLAEYSASKSFVEKLTESLAVEYKNKGVEFQCHVPLYIVSKLSKFRKPSITVSSAEHYGEQVVTYLGKSIVIVSGHYIQSIMTQILSHLPRSMYLKMTFKMHYGIRKKGIAKKLRLAKSN